MNELIIEAVLENLDTVMDFVQAQLKDCPSKTRNQIGIAVDEIFSNIAYYAYNTKDTKIGSAAVRVAVDGDITIEFEDGGISYNPLARDDPEITLSAEERQIGGLGIFLVKNIMDSVEYRREGEKNILTIKKALQK